MQQEIAMNETNPMPSMMQADSAEKQIVNTRFGEVNIAGAPQIGFPAGMLGLPDKQAYCLAEFPGDAMNSQFRLLQSLDDERLSFIMKPLGIDNGIIERADLEKACGELGIAHDKALFLLVVSVARGGGNVMVTANARAPIVVDVEGQNAWQYVLSNTAYDMKHLLNGIAQ